MEELNLELGNIKKPQPTSNSALDSLMDLMEPAGFVTDLNLAEPASATGSGLNSVNEAQSFTKSANESAIILSGIALTLTDISENLGKASTSIVNSTANSVSNTLSVSSDLVKIEPKKVELSIKDINSLSELVKELQKTKEEKTKEEADKNSPDAILATALTSLPAPTDNTGKPKLDIEVFRKAMLTQEAELANSINSTIESGGDLTDLFENTGSGTGKDGLLGNLSDKFSTGVKQAVMDYEINAVEKIEKDKAAQELLLDQNDPFAILTSITNQPTPVKEIEAPNFNKAIAQGLTDVAESNSKIVSQTNIVNQTQNTPVASPPKPINLLPTANIPQGEAPMSEEDSSQKNVAVNASDPTLAAYMLQMLNIMKSGQLKVKISN
jgi:hypothetical protein